MCKMLILMFKCVSEAAGPPWFQGLALNLVGIVTVASDLGVSGFLAKGPGLVSGGSLV